MCAFQTLECLNLLKGNVFQYLFTATDFSICAKSVFDRLQLLMINSSEPYGIATDLIKKRKY